MGQDSLQNAEGHSGTTYMRLLRATIGIAVITWDRAGSSTKGREKRAQRVAAQLEPPQGHNRLHDCTGRGHIGWKRGEVVWIGSIRWHPSSTDSLSKSRII